MFVDWCESLLLLCNPVGAAKFRVQSTEEIFVRWYWSWTRKG